jgi:DNA-binding CsgD family transcriptional regulator
LIGFIRAKEHGPADVSAAFQWRARGGRHRGGMTEDPKLTPRELDVMCLVAAGHTSRQIGGILFISPRTVEMHVEHALRKLGCATRSGAVWRLAGLGALPGRPAPGPGLTA